MLSAALCFTASSWFILRHVSVLIICCCNDPVSLRNIEVYVLLLFQTQCALWRAHRWEESTLWPKFNLVELSGRDGSTWLNTQRIVLRAALVSQRAINIQHFCCVEFTLHTLIETRRLSNMAVTNFKGTEALTGTTSAHVISSVLNYISEISMMTVRHFEWICGNIWSLWLEVNLQHNTQRELQTLTNTESLWASTVAGKKSLELCYNTCNTSVYSVFLYSVGAFGLAQRGSYNSRTKYGDISGVQNPKSH